MHEQLGGVKFLFREFLHMVQLLEDPSHNSHSGSHSNKKLFIINSKIIIYINLCNYYIHRNLQGSKSSQADSCNLVKFYDLLDT